MKTILGITLIALGIIAGLVFGLWWAFIGGIVSIVSEVRAPELNRFALAWAILKLFFAAPIGYLAALILIIPGFHILAKDGK